MLLRPNPRKHKDAEPVEGTVSVAIDALARVCQVSTMKRIGVSVRPEAAREKHRSRFQPLQPDLDKDAIGKYARSSQLILMFSHAHTKGIPRKVPDIGPYASNKRHRRSDSTIKS